MGRLGMVLFLVAGVLGVWSLLHLELLSFFGAVALCGFGLVCIRADATSIQRLKAGGICPTCKGLGWWMQGRYKQPCPVCRGTGRVGSS